MPETLVDRGDGPEWPWYNVRQDLMTQGNLEGVQIDSLLCSRYGYDGSFNGIAFAFTWAHNESLILSMERFSRPLVEAFSAVLGYKPFCRYTKFEMVTVEWDKVNPKDRYRELEEEKQDSTISALAKIRG